MMRWRDLHSGYCAAAAIALLILVTVVGWRLAAYPGLLADRTRVTLAADGREHLAATLRARHHLPLDASQLQLTGAQAAELRLEDLPGGRVAVYLRTGATPGRLRFGVAGRGGNLAISITLAVDDRDSFGDGTPDWMRLHSATDRQAFRLWFTALADRAADVEPSQLPPEIVDCSSLLRYAYRESLRVHDVRWYTQFSGEPMPALSSVQQWSYPNTPLGLGLFRVRPGPFHGTDVTDGTFAQFADAKTLIQANTFFVSRDLGAARPGDLIFFRLLETDSQYHSMVITEHSEWVVYHTGPIDNHPGEMRRVLLADLLQHPDPRWRPTPSNPNFLGVYRWNILRED
jgi:uncharacterized protein YfaT (DUF1175 family)